MKCNKVFEKIDELFDRYVDIWEEVVNIESPTMDKQRVDAVGQYFIDIAEKKGWKVEVFESVTGNVVCLTMNPDAKKQPVSLSAHMDTVHPVGHFGNPPTKRDSEKIYGPGVLDCKGGLIAALLAMDALEQCGFSDRPVMFLLQGDEEAGSRPINKPNINYICEKAQGSIAFFNLEGYQNGTAVVERKGIATYTVKITGVEAHSSVCATKGASAIAEAAHKILELEKIKDAKGVTCTCGVISGGTTHNTVPGYCEFRANFRYLNAQQYAWVEETMKKIEESVYIEGCKTEVEQYGYRPAMERVERNLKLLDDMNAIFEENGLPKLEPRAALGGADSAQVTSAGIPCLDSIGVEGGFGHNPNEYAIIESLRDSAKRLAAYIYCI